MKADLKDTTFIIPIRIDSLVRLENLIMTIDCIQRSFDTTIIVLEATSYKNEVIPSLLKSIIYSFVQDDDPVFYKTKYLNKMAKDVKTDIISIWDVDILLDPSQIWNSVQQLREENCEVAYPYNGDCFDTSDILRKHYWINRNIEFLKKHKDKMNTLYNEGGFGAVGGAVFIKTKNYLSSGMDNEDFYGWGLEDGERHYRWLELDYRIYRNENYMFHLTHPRDLNGAFRSKNHVYRATHDFNEIVNYGKEELKRKFTDINI